MTIKGAQTQVEINHQPEAWAHTIRRVEAQQDRLRALFEGVDEVIFTGCGSAYNVSQVLAPTFQHFLGIRTRAVQAAETIHFPETVYVEGVRYLVVPISRSGETTETVGACRAAKARGAKIVSITCYADSPLAQLGDAALILSEANEQSVVTTQSLTSMIVCGQAIAAVIAGNADYLTQLKRLSAVGPRVVEEAWGVSRRLVETEEITKFAFVGNGAFIGLAKECQLKLKEMVLLPSDAYPMFDYRHGPKSNVDEHMLLTMLISDRARAEEIVFLRDMKDLNGTLLVLCDQADEVIRQLADYVVEVRSDLPDFARDVLYMPMIHCLAYYTALARGYDPDNPVNLTYWVELA